MNKDNFENAMNELQSLTEKIKSDNTSLEEAVKCYEDGMKYYNLCNDILKNAKQKIEIFEGEEN